jgi:hypothetical protein
MPANAVSIALQATRNNVSAIGICVDKTNNVRRGFVCNAESVHSGLDENEAGTDERASLQVTRKFVL